MIPRPKSIFTIWEEGGKKASGRSGGSAGEPVSSATNMVGLRILIQCSGQELNVVAKSALRPCKIRARACRSPATALPELSFLKACYLCKKELSPHKDVYMYRGDQGFCSVECRCRQILIDERKEFEALARDRRDRVAAHPRLRTAAAPRARESNGRRIVPAAA